MHNILNFLKLLEQNNERGWFNAHKSDYQSARALFEQILEKIIAGLGQVDPSIKGLKAADAIFRIYRDTRFATDKTPYKNNFGAHLSRGGKNSGEPGYYFHIQPGESFLSGGIYIPSNDKLKAIRKEIFLFPEDFSALIDEPSFSKHFTFFQDDKLKRPPLGFPADFPLIDFLKFKHYCPWVPLPDEWLDFPDLSGRIVDLYSIMKPFNDFIYRALED
ncbi:MAG: DUF2461 domain-containing protein [Bacteroidia bacterium]|nr:DUF2461 domain-containing protein [Bacteroidia bacterium]